MHDIKNHFRKKMSLFAPEVCHFTSMGNDDVWSDSKMCVNVGMCVFGKRYGDGEYMLTVHRQHEAL